MTWGVPAGILVVVSVGMLLISVPSLGAQQDAAQMNRARSDYVEYCAGCHGVTGSSRPARVPELRDRIGYFLCLPEGRSYLIRLPNVANAPVEDNAALADLLNYMVSSFGGTSTPVGAAPFTGEEVASFRGSPLTHASLVSVRSQLVARMMRQCRGVPATLKNYS